MSKFARDQQVLMLNFRHSAFSVTQSDTNTALFGDSVPFVPTQP